MSMVIPVILWERSLRIDDWIWWDSPLIHSLCHRQAVAMNCALELVVLATLAVLILGSITQKSCLWKEKPQIVFELYPGDVDGHSSSATVVGIWFENLHNW